MIVHSKQADGVLKASVQEEMTIYNSQTLKETFVNFCNSGMHELLIDLSEVSELDSAGLQLLMWLKAESLKRAFELRLVGHSQAIMEIFELLKLSMYFGDPIVIPAERTK